MRVEAIAAYCQAALDEHERQGQRVKA